MRILVLPLSCALLSTCIHASETSLTQADDVTQPLTSQQSILSISHLEKPLAKEELIEEIVRDCLKSKDWRMNLKILGDYEPGAFKEFLKP